jgi:histone-lysine N-methyltransferase MLL3
VPAPAHCSDALRMLHVSVQQQRVQMRMVPSSVREVPARVVSVVSGGPAIQHAGVGVSRMGLAPPPPPPPYPGPPPPYPGPCQQVGTLVI